MLRTTERRRWSGRAGAAMTAVGLVVAVLATGAPAGATPGQLPGTGGDLPAPVTRLSADGRTATDGVRTLSVSQAADLDPAGATLTVAGAGYETFKGVYIAFCVIPPTGQLPSPCGGGMDVAGASGASQWINSNPPPYGEGLAVPYGPGGSFTIELTVSPAINPSVDCRRVRCAVVTRNDHVRSTDRSQDMIVPVTFGAAAGAGAAPTVPPTTVAPTTVPPTTAPPAPIDEPLPAPATTLSADGRSATDGTRTLTTSKAAGLALAGEPVTVTGTGYDAAKAIEVALCAVPPPGQAATACAPGTWVTADAVGPPARTYGPGGSFSVVVAVNPAIGPATDCRTTPCALLTRNDGDRPSDRSQDILVPVTFAVPATTTTSSAVPPPGDGELAAVPGGAGSTGSSAVPWIALVVVVAVLAGGAVLSVVLIRRKDPEVPA